ncbi:EAL domain-containing protein [Roseibium sp.]|uniref:EAL domain-containing protein n=1 Tax=Roseibium sp. TaxID=1936156 RepID=UPI003A96D9AE
MRTGSGSSGFQNKIYDAAERLGQNHGLIALQRGLAITLPLISVGAFALLLRYPPFGTFGIELSEAYYEACESFISATFGIAALVALIGFSITFSLLHNQKYSPNFVSPGVTATVVLSCFFIAFSDGNVLPDPEMFSLSQGFMGALLVSMVSGAMFLRLSRIDRLKLPLGALGTDPLIGDVFQLLPAAALTIGIFGGAKLAFADAVIPSLSAHLDALLTWVLAFGTDCPIFSVAYEVLSQLLWFFGLHGPNALHEVHDQILRPASAANLAAHASGQELPYVFTAQFFDFFVRMGGSGSTLSLIVALLIAGRSQTMRRLALLALVPGLFNINEPLLFGIPLVLNPLYFIPWLFAPLCQALMTYGAIIFEVMPKTNGMVTWTTPVLISGYLATDSIMGSVVQLAGLATGVLIYLPFVRLSERIAEERSQKLIDRLSSSDRGVRTSQHDRLLHLHGSTGRMAISLAHDLQQALRKRSDELFLEYQPQIDIWDQTIAGAEALLRWEHPLYGRIPPPLIIDLAEEIGQLDTLGLLVLQEACRQYREWQVRLPYNFTISVNVSPAQLRHPEFVSRTLKIIKDATLHPKMIELEVTETAALLPEQDSVLALHALRKAGVRIALDDFGMGHTSIHYLRELPVDTLKVDRSLTTASGNNANELIVQSLVDIGRSLDVQILIEGIEDEDQLERFTALGCKVFQGYLFSKPLSAKAFPAYARALMEQRHRQQTAHGPGSNSAVS